MQHELRFGTTTVGLVTQTDADFPNVWGEIVLDESLESSACEETTRMAEFIRLNRECTRLADIEHEQDVSTELDAVNQQLESYNDYIETSDWVLVSTDSETVGVMCPIFRDDGELVWRWNHAYTPQTK
tara:strand:- start:89 stop:472 length:384 start_codon:yes stop_codon:yes gene_type:complete